MIRESYFLVTLFFIMIGIKMGYFYLYYGDYVADTGTNPYKKIENAKQSIKEKALREIKARSDESRAVEEEFEELYKIKPDDFSDKNLDINTLFDIDRWQAVNSDMSNFDLSVDGAVTALKKGVSSWEERAAILNQAQQAINNIDAVLRKGAETGGLARGAMEEARKWKKKLRELKVDIKNENGDDKALAKRFIRIAGHVSGALLEIAFPYAFLSASEKGLIDLSSLMMNIGGHSGPTISKKYNQDAKIKEDIKKLRSVLKLENNNIQSKADSIINIHPDGVSGTTAWVGFQQKNYTDIKSVKLAELTIGDLTELYGNEDFLINTAGGLGYNHKQDIVYMRPHYAEAYMQKDIDNLWKEIIKSFRLALVADAVAGFVQSNFTNKVNYYVIRSKKSGEVRVIGVSSILDKIWKDFKNELNSSMGISLKEDYENRAAFNFDTRTGYRQKYWDSNVEHFQFGWPSQVKYIRSYRAAGEIWNTIRATKIKIALNFSSYFQEY